MHFINNIAAIAVLILSHWENNNKIARLNRLYIKTLRKLITSNNVKHYNLLRIVSIFSNIIDLILTNF